MALIICPECQKEISSLATACPHCGYPLSQAEFEMTNRAAESSEVSNNAVQRESKEPLPRAVFVFIGILALTVIVVIFYNISLSTVTASNVDTDSMYHSALGVGVKLGQSKSSVDDRLGTPSESYGEFVYTDGLRISYLNGKVDAISIDYPNDRWESKGGIKIDMSVNALLDILGEPNLKIPDEKQWLYQEGYHIIGFRVNSDEIAAIMIIDAHGSKLLTQEEVDATAKK